MKPDFSQPQRQSKVGIVVMFFHALQQYARALVPIILVFIFKMDEMNQFFLFLGIGVLLVGIAVVAYLQYINFTFFLDDANGEFVINDGIFNKTTTIIQLNKIQQVNINQNLIQRLIGVYALDVDTAGSAKKEGNIKAVSHQLALALKERLLYNEKMKPAAPDEINTEPITGAPFIKISLLTLLKVGITSNYVRTAGILLASLVTLYENIKNVADYPDISGDKFDSYFDKDLAVQTIAIAIVFVSLVVLVVNVARVVFKYFDFRIMRQSGSLLLSFGLINTKSTIVKPEKVQVTSISQNFFQKKMNILEMKIKQAASGEKNEEKSAIEIPGCNAGERDAILKLLFDTVPEKGVMLKPNFRKLVFSIFLTIVLPLCGFYILAEYIEPGFYEFGYLAVAYVVFALLVLCFGFRNNRLYINGDFIIRQSGAWDIGNEIIEPKKIQAITTSQLFWHKNINIGSVTLHTAGGNVSFQLAQYDKIRHYVNLWLYEIETSDSNWM